MTQNEAMQILKTGANVFLTGAAGSGKTHVLREYLKCLKDRKIPVGVTASTGIAATHMGGVTIHSWTGIGVKDEISDWDIDEISQRERISTKMRSAMVLIIDEVSMLHHYRLDMIDRVLKYVRNDRRAFGGLQLIVCGDFFQLPPISRRPRSFGVSDVLFMDDEYDQNGDAKFAYHSRSWKEADFTVCYLEENYRQSDEKYLKILNAIRSADVDQDVWEILKSRFVESSGHMVDELTKLYSHNINVDAENERELAKLKTPIQKYEMTTRGKRNLVDNLKKSCLAPEELKLKVGAKVMFVKNNFEKGYVNGTTGIVNKCTPFEIVVATKNGHVRVETDVWHIDDDGKVLAELEQYPLRLAWAITIHKSQGMSLDAALIDLSQSFEKGMGYVALSRVKTLDGLHILGMNDTALRVHEEVLEYDKTFRQMSEKAKAEMLVLGEEELGRMQRDFLGKEEVDVGVKATTAKKTHKDKTSTIDITKRMLDDGLTIGEVAEQRGLKEETIITHIEQLQLLDNTWDIKRFRKGISNEKFTKIIKMFRELGPNEKGVWSLSPVKDKLGSEFSYSEIKLARLFL